MISYIASRVLSVLTTFFIVSVIIFLMMHAIPGGPFDGGDMPVPEAVRQKLNAQYGLDQPLYVQYAVWLKNLFTLSFGESFKDNQSV